MFYIILQLLPEYILPLIQHINPAEHNYDGDNTTSAITTEEVPLFEHTLCAIHCARNCESHLLHSDPRRQKHLFCLIDKAFRDAKKF